MGRRVRYEHPESCAITMSYMISTGEEYSMPPRYERRADENPIHGGDYFIAEGEKAAHLANRQVKHMFFVVMGLLGVAYLLWRFGL